MYHYGTIVNESAGGAVGTFIGDAIRAFTVGVGEGNDSMCVL